MDKLQFTVPVRIVVTPGAPVEEIYGVEQALDFLQEWPTGRQGPVYQAAFNACFEALLDLGSTEEARKLLAAFCRVSGLVAKDMAFPETMKAELRPPH